MANPSGAITRRYVWGPGDDAPLVWYRGSGVSESRWVHADERGSVVAVSDASGAVTNINTYDDYGIPGAGNVGRFQYTGQAWLGEVGLQYSRARIYSPTLGRFLQTDPIGYGDGLNWYNYVGSDPVNRVDPSGLACRGVTKTERVKDAETGEIVEVPTVVVTAGCGGGGGGSFGGGYFGGFFSGTLKDVSTGRTYAVSAFGYGGGFVAGTYAVTGTVRGFGVLSNGLDIAFAQGPAGSGGARFSDNNGSLIGEGSVSGEIAPPIGAGVASFDPPTVTQTDAGKCK